MSVFRTHCNGNRKNRPPCGEVEPSHGIKNVCKIRLDLFKWNRLNLNQSGYSIQSGHSQGFSHYLYFWPTILEDRKLTLHSAAHICEFNCYPTIGFYGNHIYSYEVMVTMYICDVITHPHDSNANPYFLEFLTLCPPTRTNVCRIPQRTLV